MPLQTARQMVAKRLATSNRSPHLGPEAIDVITIFSGAIPREIVRHLRDTVLNAEADTDFEPEVMARDIFAAELKQWMDQLRTAPFPGGTLIDLRDHVSDIIDLLPAVSEDAWPEEADEKLRLCLTLLDSDGTLMSEETITDEEATASIDGRRRFRQTAELQACLRLLIMNQLAGFLWRSKGATFSEIQGKDAIACIRTVMLNPAIAQKMLGEFIAEHLQDYGSTVPPLPYHPPPSPRS